MNNPLDYKILEGRSPDELELFVKEYIKKGYNPIGGVSVVISDEDQWTYLQAVVEFAD